MRQKAVFHHAGCPVCAGAVRTVLGAVDRGRFEVAAVRPGADKRRLPEAEALGVKSAPALGLEGKVFHINFGAPLSEVK